MKKLMYKNVKKILTILITLIGFLGYSQPTTSAAAPTNAAIDVISIYGDTYSNITSNYNPSWGQSGSVNPNFSVSGGSVLAYLNFNYQGTLLATQNASGMEFLHIDIWTAANPGATTIQVSPINNGSGTGETLVSITYNSGTWTSVDIPKSAFTGMTWDSVIQMKFAANGPGSTVPVDIYLDNIYFWKTPSPVNDVTGDVYINDGTFAAGDFTTAAGQDIATNDGSAAEPFATLDYALARSIQGPGDVIYIDAGTYSWPTTHALTDSGTLANPITIQGKGINETNITTTAATTTSAGLHFTTGNHWVVKDLNWTATAARAVWVADVDGITLDNCTINMTYNSTPVLQSIIIGTAGGELTIKNSTLTRSNTTFHMIEVVEGTTLIMQDNTVSFNALSAVGTATSVQLRTNSSSLFIIERNKFVNGGYGIGNVLGTAGPVNASSIIKNNFFNSFWGIVTTIVQGLTVHNNSFYTNGESIYGIANGSLTNWDIRNNILYTYGSTRSCILSGSATSHPAVMDYNHYYSPNTGAARQGSTSGPILSFTEWQNAAGGPWEANGQGGNAASFDPLYVDAANGDLHLQPGSPAIGAGVDVGITDDIDGDPRPLSGNFDIGADQFIATVSSVATLSDLQVDGVSISGFNPVTADYTVVLSCPVSSIPQIITATPTSSTTQSVVITQATDVFEDATVVVTAEDGVTTETYTIRIGLVTPVIIQDFENEFTFTFAGFEGLGGVSIEAAPTGDNGISLKLEIVTTGQPWQGAEIVQLEDLLDLTDNKTVQVDVYATQSFNLLLKVESGGPNSAASQSYTTPNEWQTLTFTMDEALDGTSVANGVYGKIVFFPNWNAANTGFNAPTDFTAFVDNIRRLSSVQTQRLTYTYDNGGWLPSDPTGNFGCKDILNIVDGDLTMTTDAEVDNITIAPGASLTVNTGVTLTAETVNLNSTSSSFSSLIVNGTVNGTVTYNRYTALIGSQPTGTNDLIASPVSGQTFNAFATANQNLAASGTLRAFAPYNTSAGEYQNYDTVLNAGTLISPGTGYRMATTDGSPLTFTGTVSDADVLNISISDATAGFAWNLIGNPYPSYIDFATFFNHNKAQFETGPFQAIYGYNGTGWTIWNETTILDTDVTELITPGQGFYVKSKVSGGLVDFTTAMRTFGTSDDFILGRSSNTLNVASSKLILSNAAQEDKTRIYFIEGKTRGLDSGFDAAAFRGAAGDFSIFTNLVEGNEGLDMDIQTLGYDDFNDVIIPLGIKALAGSALTIKLDENSNLPSHINVYLEDTLENTLTLLNTSDYVFSSANDLVGTGRFFLRYAASALSLNANDGLTQLMIYTNGTTKDITVKGQLTATTTASLYDLQGRLVLSSILDQSRSTNTIDVSAISSGVYIVKVSSRTHVKTQKLIIK